jgi:hypothetical protein
VSSIISSFLNTVKDPSERERILKLLAEERQKQRDAGDDQAPLK